MNFRGGVTLREKINKLNKYISIALHPLLHTQEIITYFQLVSVTEEENPKGLMIPVSLITKAEHCLLKCLNKLTGKSGAGSLHSLIFH